MGATDGVTPLNAANVIHKQSADEHYGKLFNTYYNQQDKGIEIVDSGITVSYLMLTQSIANKLGSGLNMVIPFSVIVYKAGTALPSLIYHNILFPFRTLVEPTISIYPFDINYNVASISYSFIDKPELYTNSALIAIQVQSTALNYVAAHGYIKVYT